MKNFDYIQKCELESWLPDKDKIQREAIRYPLLKKQMGLDFLDTSEMVVADIGCGPLGGVSSILNCDWVDRYDPLMEEYKKLYPQNNGYSAKAEDLEELLGDYDLIIITNALDHCEDPERVLVDLIKYMKPGAFFSHLHAINNAITHPHKAHTQNVNPEMFNQYLKDDFECVWYLDFRKDNLTYGWKHQMAFSGLYRKVTGY